MKEDDEELAGLESSMIDASPQARQSEAEQHALLLNLQQQIAQLREAIKKVVPAPDAMVDGPTIVDAMEIETQQTTNTGVSSIGRSTNVSTNGSEVSMGPKGKLSHKHQNGRKKVVQVDSALEKQRLVLIFAGLVTEGNVAKVAELQQRFEELDRVNSAGATAMLSPFILNNGVKDRLLRVIFGTGYGRFVTARDGPKEIDDNSSGGRNSGAFGEAELLHLRRFIESKFIPLF